MFSSQIYTIVADLYAEEGISNQGYEPDAASYRARSPTSAYGAPEEDIELEGPPETHLRLQNQEMELHSMHSMDMYRMESTIPEIDM